MQSWSLREAIVKAVPKEALLILDLRGSSTSKAEFWGYPTVVGNLHNFGGRINMHGDLALLASNQYSKAKRLNPAVCGSGLLWKLSSRIRYIMNWLLKCLAIRTVLICALG